MTRRLWIFLPLVLCMGFPLMVRAQNLIGLQVKNSFISDPGFDVVSANDLLSQVEFQYARELLVVGPGGLWLEADYTLGSSKSELFNGAWSTKAFLHALTFGGCYRLPLWSWLVPRARIGLGVLMGRLSVTTEDSQEAEDSAVAFSGHLLAGVELLWPRQKRRDGWAPTTGGLVLEAGYGFSSPLEFELAPQQDEQNPSIPLTPSAVGSLALYGFQLRIGALIRF